MEVESLNFGIKDSKDLNLKYKTYIDKKIKQKESLDFNIKSDKEKSDIEEVVTKKIVNPENIIENKIFPRDDEMPELDEDIKNIEFSESEGSLPNSIQPLTDADIVNKSGSIDDI